MVVMKSLKITANVIESWGERERERDSPVHSASIGLHRKPTVPLIHTCRADERSLREAQAAARKTKCEHQAEDGAGGACITH